MATAATQQTWWYQAIRRTAFPLMLIIFVGPYVYLTEKWYAAQASGIGGYFTALPSGWAVHWGVTGTLLFCLFYERLMPHTPQKLEKGEFMTDALYYFLRVHGQLLRFAILGVAWVSLNTFGVALSLPEPWLPPAHTYMPFGVAVIVVCILAEFPDYWAHRMLHRVPFLWRAHAIHHSSHNLYALMTIRAHPFDYMFKQISMYSVLYMCGFSLPMIIVWMMVRAYAAILAHSNADYWNPWLSYIFNTNHVHAWHHSTKAAECECNFGVGLMIWDQVFGTYYNPKAPLRPEKYGLFKEQNFPVTGFFQQLIAPFRWRHYMGSRKTATPKTALPKK